MVYEPSTEVEPRRDWLSSLSESQRAIVVALKMRGTVSAKELAEQLFLTVGGVRHHLTLMVSAGLVTAHQEHGPRGRPGLHYTLTERGHGLFMDGHMALATEIIGELEQFDPAVLELLMAGRASRLLGEAKRLSPGANTEDRLAGALSVFDRHGCMPLLEIEDNGTAQVTLRHCPLLAAARVSSSVCTSEVTFLHAALGDRKVSLQQHRLAGAAICRFQIEADDVEPAAK